MKKTLLCALIFCLHNCSFGQTSIPLDSFYVPGASWTEVATTQYGPCSAGTENSKEAIVYKIEQDSIISGKKYHMLSQCDIGGYGNSVDCNSGVSTEYIGGGPCTSPAPIFAMLRTDSNRVYFTLLVSPVGRSFGLYDCDSIGKEYLFYDFNLGIGSVIPSTTLWGGMTVTSIDSVCLSNGIYVPRYDQSVVYGIGAPEGFINYWNLFICGPGPDANQFMLCYNNPHFNYHFSYPAGTLPGNLQNDCFNVGAYIVYLDSLDSISNINSNTSNSNGIANTYGIAAFSMFPNPATNQLTVIDSASINTVSITNSIGQTVYTDKYDPYHYNPLAQLDISALPAGLYFIRINNNKAHKFVKQTPHRK